MDFQVSSGYLDRQIGRVVLVLAGKEVHIGRDLGALVEVAGELQTPVNASVKPKTPCMWIFHPI